MIKAVILHHPQSAQLVPSAAFPAPLVQPIRIACGTSRMPGVELSEAEDFYPNYASWNSALFEASVILTVWEHADRLLGQDDVAFLHSDVQPNGAPPQLWQRVSEHLRREPQRAVSLTAPAWMEPRLLADDFYLPESVLVPPQRDPMMLSQFAHGVQVWEFLQRCDPELYAWAQQVQPRIVYAHQFACSRAVLDQLGQYLYQVVGRLCLRDVGLWTPHVFERLIGLWLVRHGGPAVHTTAFWHQHSSGNVLYGPRPLRYYRALPRVVPD